MFVTEDACSGCSWNTDPFFAQTITVTYASDVTPVVLRPYLTSYVNLCWVFGQFIAAGVLRGFLNRDDQWAYRVPFAIQWVGRVNVRHQISLQLHQTFVVLPFPHH